MTGQPDIHLGYVFNERPQTLADQRGHGHEVNVYTVPPRGSRVVRQRHGNWIAVDGYEFEWVALIGDLGWMPNGRIDCMPSCQAFSPLSEDTRT